MAIRMPSFSASWMVASLFALACVGCASPWATEPVTGPPTQPQQGLSPSQSEQALQRAVKTYEEGVYKSAARQFQAALDLGLESKHDQATAHKYLGFIDCASGRGKACRNEFRKAFAADPKFDLEAAEAGHPIWGPVFRSVKYEVAAKTKAR